MTFIKKQIYKFFHSILEKDKVCSTWDFLEKSQWWDKETLLDFQSKKLDKIMKHAVGNVPYYQRVYASIKNDPEDLINLQDFPILTKSIIRENQQALQTTNIDSYRPVKNSTSGSTGESIFFLQSRNWVDWTTGLLWRGYGWCGISPFDSRASLWGASFDKHKTNFLKDLIKKYVMPSLFLSSYDLSEDNMKKYISSLKKHKPKLLISYPSPLEEFAIFCNEYNHDLKSLKTIVSSAEQLFDHQRKLFEDVFRVPVFNRYGCREFGNVAQECNLHEGLHVNSEHVFIEIIDEKGNPCAPGVLGELIITDLDNLAMPFIRYKVGDYACWAEKKCSCGRSLPCLEKMDGRSFDLIKTKDGSVISGTFWTILTRSVSDDIASIQICQKTLETILILLKTHSGQPLDEKQEIRLREEIIRKAPELHIAIQYVDKIPLTKSGKHRFVINELA